MYRDVLADFGGTLPDEYKGCQLYYDQQKTHFGQLQRICSCELESQEPGKLSFSLAGYYR